ncbi:TetR/AcrR family transcriptional regulator [Brachybacterium phenoliresistens]|uniref:TetR/AcrR family transcriptional regulator n=1 Tax=Brachybacterium phenoliresistens TaxID=396014 RepID=UPI0004B234EE|nr:TetR/AcrR family transcriptional regulator [Brachybacterium phenoliresistens]
MAATSSPRPRAARMTGRERREQLVQIGRSVFAQKGFDATSVEEIAARAKVSKPIVYEHFGGKEGLYAVIVDRETSALLGALETALDEGRSHPRVLMERAALAFLTYIDESEDGFRILVRDSPVAQSGGTFSSLLGDVAAKVESILAAQLRLRKYSPRDAELYAQMLVGMVAYTGQWWLETRKPSKEEVAARMVNLSWFGLGALEKDPGIRGV